MTIKYERDASNDQNIDEVVDLFKISAASLLLVRDLVSQFYSDGRYLKIRQIDVPAILRRYHKVSPWHQP